MLRSVAVSLLCACFAAACGDDSSSTLALYAPTLLTVDPTSFQAANVSCGTELRKYVVTLFDVTGGMAANLGSAPPTECTLPTTFGIPMIQAGFPYVAEIDGFDREDILPQASGSRTMVDQATMMTKVEPKWTT